MEIFKSEIGREIATLSRGVRLQQQLRGVFYEIISSIVQHSLIEVITKFQQN
jgi:hypothetical protein